MNAELKCLSKGFRLAEGPLWLSEYQKLAFIDIEGKSVFIASIEKGIEKHIVLNNFVGSLFLKNENTLVVAEKNQLVEFDLKSSNTSVLASFNISEGLRFNDGKCDDKGRIWVGTMAIDQSSDIAKGGGSFYLIENNKVVFENAGYSIPNGIAFLDSKTFYHTDTATNSIQICKYDEMNKTLQRENIIEFSQYAGSPDGFCKDVDGNLWVALWGAGKVVCINPITKTEIYNINLPEKNVTSCAFGGKDMDTLFITTAAEEKVQGAVYYIKTNTKGTMEYYYKY